MMNFVNSIFYVAVLAPLFVAAFYMHKPKRNNMVSLLTFGVFVVAVAIGMSGNLNSGLQSTGLLNDVASTFLFGVIGLGLQWSALFINDEFIQNTYSNDEAINAGNMSVGIVEMGTMIATSFVVYASMQGDGAIWSMLVFFGLAQILMIFGSKVSEFLGIVSQKFILNDQRDVAALWASKLIAIGQITAVSLIGSQSSFLNDLGSFIVYAIFGLMVLFVTEVLFEFAIDKYFDGWEVSNTNVMKAFSTIAVSTVVAATLL